MSSLFRVNQDYYYWNQEVGIVRSVAGARAAHVSSPKAGYYLLRVHRYPAGGSISLEFEQKEDSAHHPSV
jgi:hypothetical protein